MEIKKFLKSFIGTMFSPLNSAVVVNSYGRSGSTVLTNTIIRACAVNKIRPLEHLISRSVSKDAWVIDNTRFRKGFVYKSHDYPPVSRIDCKIKFIYIYSNPYNVVFSLLRLMQTKGENWMRKHYEHLKAEYTDFPNIIYEDQLGLSRHLNSWLKEDRYPVALIKYENLWDYEAELSQFLDLPINLSEYQQRKAIQPHNLEIEKAVRETYGQLYDQVDKMEPLIINNSTFAV